MHINFGLSADILHVASTVGRIAKDDACIAISSREQPQSYTRRWFAIQRENQIEDRQPESICCGTVRRGFDVLGSEFN